MRINSETRRWLSNKMFANIVYNNFSIMKNEKKKTNWDIISFHVTIIIYKLKKYSAVQWVSWCAFIVPFTFSCTVRPVRNTQLRLCIFPVFPQLLGRVWHRNGWMILIYFWTWNRCIIETNWRCVNRNKWFSVHQVRWITLYFTMGLIYYT